jgi:hypothetical protein
LHWLVVAFVPSVETLAILECPSGTKLLIAADAAESEGRVDGSVQPSHLPKMTVEG